MNISKALDYFEDQKLIATKSSYIKVYDQFIAVFMNLKSKKLSAVETMKIEEEIDGIILANEANLSRQKLKRKLSTFKVFLKDTFSFVSEGYYTGLGIVFGTTIGTALGIFITENFERNLGIVMANIFGFVVGYSIGLALDQKAKGENKVI